MKLASLDLPAPLLVAGAFGVSITWLLIRRSRRPPFPPGPSPDPVIGNLRQMGGGNLEQVFSEWGKEYGPVNHASVLGQHLVVLNSFDAAHELLEHRGLMYSNRPRLVTFAEMMGWGAIISQMDPGPRWKKHRRIIQERFSPRYFDDYAGMQKRAVYSFVAGLGRTPEKLRDHIKRFAAAMIVEITYGYIVESVDDSFIHLADEAAVESLRHGPPGGTPCDILPILKHWPTWMPFSFYQRHAAYTKSLVDKLFTWPLNWAEQQIADGAAPPSMAQDLLAAIQSGKKVSGETLDYDDVKHICGAVYGGGSDTSTSVLGAFFLAMTLYPDAYEKARRSIDEVVGTDRLVDIADRESLPYITCVVKEVLRWGVPTPLGVPHRLTRNDPYEGYVLPEGASVFYNVWGYTRNEDVYPNPEVFDPDRFVNPSKPEVLRHVDAVWGFGRRTCPGKAFAEANLWLVIANTIAVMDLRRVLDKNGNPVTPAGEFESGAIRHAKPFECSLTYRSEKARQLVAEAEASLVA